MKEFYWAQGISDNIPSNDTIIQTRQDSLLFPCVLFSLLSSCLPLLCGLPSVFPSLSSFILSLLSLSLLCHFSHFSLYIFRGIFAHILYDHYNVEPPLDFESHYNSADEKEVKGLSDALVEHVRRRAHDYKSNNILILW